MNPAIAHRVQATSGEEVSGPLEWVMVSLGGVCDDDDVADLRFLTRLEREDVWWSFLCSARCVHHGMGIGIAPNSSRTAGGL